jgi:hypothetical protein
MKTLAKIGCLILLAIIISNPLAAQTEKTPEKKLKEKASRQARKEARKYTKDDYYIAPGALPLEKQLENAWLKQYENDDKGFPRYIVESGNSVAETQTAAKLQANETAKLNIAGAITTNVAALIENNIANMQLNNEDAASVTKTVAASKNLIAQELGRTLPLVEIYKKIGKNVEANIRLAYDYQNAIEQAKKIIRKQLEEETKILQDKLDGLMKF